MKIVQSMSLVPMLCRVIGYFPTSRMTAIGCVDSRGVHAICGYDGYNGTSVQMHLAAVSGKKWMTREYLHACFDYPFNVLKCNVLIGVVPSGNEMALTLNARLGFKEIARIEGGHPDGALIIMKMHRAECRWLGVHKHGKEKQQPASAAGLH